MIVSELGVVSLERKFATTLAFARLSIIVLSKSCSNNNHLANLPSINGYFIIYLMVA